MDDNCLCDNDKLHLDDDAEGRCGPSQSLFSHDDDARGDLCRSGCEIRELQPDGPRRASSAKTTLIVLMMFRRIGSHIEVLAFFDDPDSAMSPRHISKKPRRRGTHFACRPTVEWNRGPHLREDSQDGGGHWVSLHYET